MVYLFLADGFEEVEAITPIDYIRRCGIEVCSVGVNGKQIKGAHGLVVDTDIEISEYNVDANADMIILPGGLRGTENLKSNDRVIESIKKAHVNSSVAAICAAPAILGKLGLLQGRKACCYPGFEKYLEGAKISFEPVVVDNNIITSRGPGTAQQFSFEIIEYLTNREKAYEISQQVKWVF